MGSVTPRSLSRILTLVTHILIHDMPSQSHICAPALMSKHTHRSNLRTSMLGSDWWGYTHTHTHTHTHVFTRAPLTSRGHTPTACKCRYTHTRTWKQVSDISAGLSGIEASASGKEKALCSGGRCPCRAGTRGPSPGGLTLDNSRSCSSVLGLPGTRKEGPRPRRPTLQVF